MSHGQHGAGLRALQPAHVPAANGGCVFSAPADAVTKVVWIFHPLNVADVVMHMSACAVHLCTRRKQKRAEWPRVQSGFWKRTNLSYCNSSLDVCSSEWLHLSVFGPGEWIFKQDNKSEKPRKKERGMYFTLKQRNMYKVLDLFSDNIYSCADLL